MLPRTRAHRAGGGGVGVRPRAARLACRSARGNLAGSPRRLRRARREARILGKYLKPDLLIIDDMGLKVLPPKSGEILLEIIMRRYENRSTMMTSNRPIEEWGKLLADVPAASAILDRLLHHAEIIAVNGRSYRLKESAEEKTTRAAKSRAHGKPAASLD